MEAIFFQNVIAAGEFAENRVIGRQGIIGVHDEKLRAIGIAARVGHRQSAATVGALDWLVVEFIAGATGAGASRIAALNHKTGNDAVKNRAIVKAIVGQKNESY